jgi:hypothetical protein
MTFEEPNEIKLSYDPSNSPTIINYPERLAILKEKIKDVILSTTVHSAGVFNANIEWRQAPEYKFTLTSRVKNQWMADGLYHWQIFFFGEFSEDKTNHWCQMMNEDLMNSLVIAFDLFSDAIKGYKYSTLGDNFTANNVGERIRQDLRPFLIYMIDMFFSLSDKNEKSFGLAKYFKVLQTGNPDSIMVPTGIQYESPAAFAKLIKTCRTEYFMLFVNTITSSNFMLSDGDEYIPLFLANELGNLGILNPRAKTSEDWVANGYDRWSEIILSYGGCSPSNHKWCVMMNARLLDQVYFSVNALLFLFNKHGKSYVPPVDPIAGELQVDAQTYLLTMIIPPVIVWVCCGFFDALDISANAGRVEDRNIVVFSGTWGMPMLFHQHFVKASLEMYSEMYHSDPGVERNSKKLLEELDPLPYPCLYRSDWEPRELAIGSSFYSPSTRGGDGAGRQRLGDFPGLVAQIARLSRLR